MLQLLLLKTGYHVNINDPACAPGCRMMPRLLILHDRLANDPAAVAGGLKTFIRWYTPGALMRISYKTIAVLQLQAVYKELLQ